MQVKCPPLCFSLRLFDGWPCGYAQLLPRVPCCSNILTCNLWRVYFCGGPIRQYGLQNALRKRRKDAHRECQGIMIVYYYIAREYLNWQNLPNQALSLLPLFGNIPHLSHILIHGSLLLNLIPVFTSSGHAAPSLEEPSHGLLFQHLRLWIPFWKFLPVSMLSHSSVSLKYYLFYDASD